MWKTIRTQNWQRIYQRINTLNRASIWLQAGKEKAQQYVELFNWWWNSKLKISPQLRFDRPLSTWTNGS